jgi:predicted NAD/FAD-binding protein
MTARATRRTFLKAGSAAVVGLSIQGGTRSLFADGRPRVGIIGGGLAGVSCAWLRDGVADAVLFEARHEVGGHAQTIPVRVGDRVIQVDVGAQFFANGTHPTYTKLLEIIGLLDPADPNRNATVDAEMTITVTQAGGLPPRFVSPATNRLWPILAPWNGPALGAFLVFALAAMQFVEDGDWLISLGDWLDALPVGPEERDGLLLPLLAALTGCSIEQAPGLSARSAIFFIGKALPSNLLDLRYNNSLLGLGGNVEYLARRCPNLTSRLGSPVTSVQPTGNGYQIRGVGGMAEDVDVVVFANPPFRARRLLPDIPELSDAAAVLERFEYFTAEISIHRDPVYVPRRRAFWSAYNADIEDGHCEGSIWYGALRPVPPGGTPLRLFKS